MARVVVLVLCAYGVHTYGRRGSGRDGTSKALIVNHPVTARANAAIALLTHTSPNQFASILSRIKPQS